MSPLTTPAPAQGLGEAPLGTPRVPPEETEAELEACEPSEPWSAPAPCPAAVAESGPAAGTSEEPQAEEEDPSLGPVQGPASEEELPMKGPTPGPTGETAHAVPREESVSPARLFISLYLVLLILFLRSPWRTCFVDLFRTLGLGASLTFLIFSCLVLAFLIAWYNPL